MKLCPLCGYAMYSFTEAFANWDPVVGTVADKLTAAHMVRLRLWAAHQSHIHLLKEDDFPEETGEWEVQDA